MAVGAVVAFHAFPAALPGGFVGVDIFFVISGYLITNILRSNAHGLSGLAQFYHSRARRIFPALILVLSASLAAGWFLLLADEYANLGQHVLAGSTFTSNILLWSEAGYFDRAATLKPLLHLWSLGVEEQFYLTWPLLLFSIRAIGLPLRGSLAVMLGLSLAYGLYTTRFEPSSAFYLPFARAAELVVGAILSTMLGAGRPNGALPSAARSALSAIGLVLIAGSAIGITSSDPFPGWRMLLPVMGAALVIGAGADAGPNRLALAARPMISLGLISYPLYLWHWPLISFLHLVSLETARWPIRLAAVGISIVLAYATWRAVEMPIRRQPPRASMTIALATALVLTGIAGALVYGSDGAPGRAAQRETRLAPGALDWKFGTNNACLARYPYKGAQHGWWFCAMSADRSPEIILLGNSYANHLYPGLVAALPNRSILSIGTCDPVRRLRWGADIIPPSHPCYGDLGAEQAELIDGIVSRSPSLRLAILSSAWPDFDAVGRHIDSAGHPLSPIGDYRGAPSTSSLDVYSKALETLIADLQDRGLRVVLVMQKPELHYDIRLCLSRPLKAAVRDCRLERSAALRHQKVLRDRLLEIAARHAGLVLFDPYDSLCRGAECEFLRNGQPLLRDIGHLSVLGSRIVARDLVATLRREDARMLPK